MYVDYKFLFLAILFFLILTCGIIYFYYRKYIRPFSSFPSYVFLTYVLKCILMRRIPKDIPINHFFFQHLIETLKRFQEKGMCLIWGFEPYLCIYSEETFKVFSNENSTINKPYEFDLFKDFFMESLLTSGGNLWRQRRKMLNPVFYSHNLKNKVQIINKNARILVENLETHKKESLSNVIHFLKICTFSNIYEFAIDLESNDEYYPDINRVFNYVNKGSEMIVYRIFHPWLCPRPMLFLFKKGRCFLQVIEDGLKMTEEALEKIKSSFLYNESNKEKGNEKLLRNSGRTFARVIMEQHMKDSTYTFTDMIGEAIGMISAGYDTVSYALMWSLFLLGHNPEVQHKVYEEVESVMGHNNYVSYEDLQDLKYLECVIKEALRIYPPVPLYARRTVKDIKIGEHIVPKGTTVAFCTYSMHRDPGMFPDPEKFDPERFRNGNSEKKVITYNFAEGVRNCIGKNFAMLELKIVLAHVTKNYIVTSLDRREDVLLSWEVVLTPVKPLRMCLTPRQ